MALINRLRPVPLESLDSLLQRLRLANHYQERAWLGDLLGRHPARPDVLRRVADFQTLSVLTGLDRDALIELTLHRFAPWYGVAQRPPRPVLPAVLPIALWPDISAQGNTRAAPAVCPACWGDQQVILLPWSLHHLTACPRHQVLLHDRCPGCHGRVWLDVERVDCGRCGHAIAEVAMRSIAADPDAKELVALLWQVTGCAERPGLAAGPPVARDHPLWRLGTPGVLKGLWGCAQALVARDGPVEAGGTRLRLQVMEIADVHEALVAAWRLLRDWPMPGDERDGGVGAGEAPQRGGTPPFPIVLGDCAWKPASAGWFGLVQERTAEGYSWSRPDLPACPAAPCLQRSERWDGEDLWLGLEEAAMYCQVSPHDLDGLTNAGLIQPTFGPFLGDAPCRWFYSERTLRRGLDTLLGHLPVRALNKIGDPIGDLAWALTYGQGRIALIDLLRMVRAGTLPAFRARATVELCDVWFECAAIMGYLERLQR